MTPTIEVNALNFTTLQTAVAKQFKRMSEGRLFLTAVDKEELWQTYLRSFPAGSNPVYKTRTEHDCGCCRQFVKTLGGVVNVVNGQLVTLWDFQVDGAYQAVADAMAAFVRSHAIDNVFLHYETLVGTVKSNQLLEDKSVKTWDHFHVNLPSAAVVKKDRIGTQLGDHQSTFDVMKRGVSEIMPSAVDTVLDLIAQNSLYRGEEHKATLEDWRKLQQRVVRAAAEQDTDLDRFVWENLTPAGRIRNTAIGTLLVDLSEGKDLEDAVKSFEQKVAPTNYKRPTALVTPAMISKARETVAELGLTSALERRYATIDDITVNNILFANRDAKKSMNVFDELSAGAAVDPKKLGKVEEVSITDFVEKILPTAQSVEALFENRHAGNLVSLIAPVDPTAKQLFKWPNGFSWSYVGDLADSIKERVKQAGGSVVGDLCCRLAWDYTDDLDFHMKEPDGHTIYYPNKRMKSRCGGELDLDANGGDGIRANPAENIFYSDRSKMREGVYTLMVNNYNRRSGASGFEIEIEFDGQTVHIAYEKALRTSETVTVAKIQYSKAKGFEIVESLPSSSVSKELWGLKTQTFQKVRVVMHSPNHWDGNGVGNKHFLFMLDGCLNDGTARGFFNEFLAESLTPHRKVLEMVGAKMKTETSDAQLSGLGFSSTQRNHLLCRVAGSFTRVVKVLF